MSASETVGRPSAARANSASAAGQRSAPLRRVELVGEPDRRDGLVVDLPVRVAARCEDEHRAAQGGLAVGRIQVDVVDDEPGQHDEQLAGVGVEARCFELL